MYRLVSPYLDTVPTQCGKINKGLETRQVAINEQAGRFAIGQLVSRNDHPQLSIVLLRTVTSRDHEVNGIRRLRDDWDIMIKGDVLVAVAEEDVESVALAEEQLWNA